MGPELLFGCAGTGRARTGLSKRRVALFKSKGQRHVMSNDEIGPKVPKPVTVLIDKQT